MFLKSSSLELNTRSTFTFRVRGDGRQAGAAALSVPLCLLQTYKHCRCYRCLLLLILDELSNLRGVQRQQKHPVIVDASLSAFDSNQCFEAKMGRLCRSDELFKVRVTGEMRTLSWLLCLAHVTWNKDGIMTSTSAIRPSKIVHMSF